jgi:hypothetical protein
MTTTENQIYEDPAGEEWTVTTLGQLSDAECRKVLGDVVDNDYRPQVLLRGVDGEIRVESERRFDEDYRSVADHDYA